MQKLRVATHNICHMGLNPIDRKELFPGGAYRNGYEADMVEEMKYYWKAVESSFSADLMGLQEYFHWFDLARKIRTDAEVYVPFGYTVTNGGHGLALASKVPVTLEIETTFAPISERRWQKFRTKIGGTELAVFNMHPMPGGPPKRPESPAIRQKEYAFIIEELKKEETFILFGDYNGRTNLEYAPFADAGFPMTNTGLVTVEGGQMCDNIVVSPNIKIERVEIFDKQFHVSDHAVLYAELLIP
ncbi:MAG: endonuclease/exonuclease/phosphatase family protein [Lachnospiraceae bacterium]|nr:endonuclease/exonuclease/phosphatase family protein [Lachnospiraceae bacterium]